MAYCGHVDEARFVSWKLHRRSEMMSSLKSAIVGFVCIGLLTACAAPSLNEADRKLLNQALEASQAAQGSASKAATSASQAAASAKRAESAADRAEAAATRAEDAAAQAERSAERAEKAFEMSLRK